MAIISLGLPLLATSCNLPGHLTERAAPRPSPILTDRSTTFALLGLAPGGVCPAGDIAAAAGGLLHHRFTLTCRIPSGRQCASLLHLPSGYPARPLAGTVLFGVRTFLSSKLMEPRPPGQLDNLIVSPIGTTLQENSHTGRDAGCQALALKQPQPNGSR